MIFDERLKRASKEIMTRPIAQRNTNYSAAAAAAAALGNDSWWARLNKFNKMAIHVRGASLPHCGACLKLLMRLFLAAMRVFKLKLNNACQNCQGSGAREGGGK